MQPLCVDLDGTLIYNDVTLIAYGDYIYGHQFKMLAAAWWLLKGGRALLKHELACRIDINPAELHYNEKVLEYIDAHKCAVGKVFLATACNIKYANAVAEHLGIFDGVIASDIRNNLRAEAKANELVARFGDKGFIYIGNSVDDLKVWEHSSKTVVTNPARGVLERVGSKEYELI